MLSLRTLGTQNLLHPDGVEIATVLAQPKRFALLVYLAVAAPGGFHRRDTLLALLWPDRDEEHARNSLSQGLSFLRRNTPEGTVVSRGNDQVAVSSDQLSVDALEFQVAADEGRWADALDLYRGEFLPGFHIPGAPGFDEWMQSERDRLRDAAARSGWALAREQVQRGAVVEAERVAKRAMNLVCPDEGTVRAFMSALARANNRVAALRIFEKFCSRLERELDLKPSEGLAEVAEELRRTENDAPASTWEAPSAPSSALLPFLSSGARRPEREGVPFFGREPQIERLSGYLHRALSGRGCAVFITGEAGTGKTRLAEGFSARALAAHPDLVKAVGFCDAHTGIGDPYHPFRGVLRLLTGDVEALWTAGALSTDHAHRLWGLLPTATEALLEYGPDLVGTFIRREPLAARAVAFGHGGLELASRLAALDVRAEDGPGVPHQAALFDQYARVLRRISLERPLLIVLEDLQWGDSASLELLFHLGRHLDGTRVLILGLFRPSEVGLGRNGGRHPLEKVFNEFRSSLGEIEVRLDEYPDRGFVDALLDREPNGLGEHFRGALLERTRGNALFCVEMMRALVEGGGLVRDGTGRLTESTNLSWNLLPARVEAVVAERTGRVPGPLRRVLSVASVEGEQFTLEVVARVLGEEPHQLLEAVGGELQKRHRLVQLVAVERSGGQRLSVFRFRHILFQEFLYRQLDAAERAYLHERVGRALEELLDEGEESRPLALARHFLEAGLVEEGVGFLALASEKANASAAYREAIIHLQRALGLIESLPPSQKRDRLELRILSTLAPISWMLGFVDERSANALDRLRSLAEKLEDHHSHYWVQACRVAECHFTAEQDQEEAILDEMEAVAGRSGDPSHDVALHGFRALNFVNLGKPSEAIFHIERFEELYDADRDGPFVKAWVTDPVPIYRALSALALGPLGYPEKAVARIEEARASVEAGGDSSALLWVACYDLLLRWLMRDAEAVCQVHEPFSEVAGAVAHEGWKAMGTMAMGWCAALDQEPEKGVEMMQGAIEVWDRNGWLVWRPFMNSVLADALCKNGRSLEAQQLLEEGLDRIERTGERCQEPEVNRGLGEVLLSLPEADSVGAETAFRRAIAIAREQETKLYELRATVSLARLLRDQGRAKEARKALSKCYGWFTEGFGFPDLKEARALLEELG
jgi:DNA-binding SARP family transcriptional activator/tetratricopeptide (TPR) repeat protein